MGKQEHEPTTVRYYCFTCKQMKAECVVVDIFGGTLCKECAKKETR